MKTLPDDASDNQTGNIPTGYYRRNTGMLNMLPVESAQSPSALTGEQLAKLDGMSREELIALVRLCNAEQIGIAMMSSEEIKAATRLKLAMLAITNKDDKVSLVAIQQLLDRLEGKPLGASPSIMIGGNGGNMQVEVVLVSAKDYQKRIEQSKVIDN